MDVVQFKNLNDTNPKKVRLLPKAGAVSDINYPGAITKDGAAILMKLAKLFTGCASNRLDIFNNTITVPSATDLYIGVAYNGGPVEVLRIAKPSLISRSVPSVDLALVYILWSGGLMSPVLSPMKFDNLDMRSGEPIGVPPGLTGVSSEESHGLLSNTFVFHDVAGETGINLYPYLTDQPSPVTLHGCGLFYNDEGPLFDELQFTPEGDYLLGIGFSVPICRLDPVTATGFQTKGHFKEIIKPGITRPSASLSKDGTMLTVRNIDGPNGEVPLAEWVPFRIFSRNAGLFDAEVMVDHNGERPGPGYELGFNSDSSLMVVNARQGFDTGTNSFFVYTKQLDGSYLQTSKYALPADDGYSCTFSEDDSYVIFHNYDGVLDVHDIDSNGVVNITPYSRSGTFNATIPYPKFINVAPNEYLHLDREKLFHLTIDTVGKTIASQVVLDNPYGDNRSLSPMTKIDSTRILIFGDEKPIVVSYDNSTKTATLPSQTISDANPIFAFNNQRPAKATIHPLDPTLIVAPGSTPWQFTKWYRINLDGSLTEEFPNVI